jgi:preprotein translocase subunit SecF
MATKSSHPAHHKKHSEPKKSFLEKVKEIYFRDYKKLIVIPWVLFILAALVLVGNYFQTGDFIRRDVSLKGGISITINAEYGDVNDLELFLTERFPDASIGIRTIESRGRISGLIIEATDIQDEALLDAIREKIELTKENYSTETMGSSLGESFYQQMFIAMLLAFVCMGLVFQLYFKNIYGTTAALFSAFMDIFITLGIMTFFGMRLTAGGIAAYLMLIGYSIDTSILLSTKLLKERQDPLEKRLTGALKTGMTMSAAGIVATGISFLFTNNIILKQIMLILVVGLVMDILTTWIWNAGFLRFYLEKENVKN